MNPRKLFGAIALAAILAAPSHAEPPSQRAEESLARLRAAHERIAPRLRDSPFGRPLAIDSRQASGRLEGDVFAVLEQGFGQVRDGLHEASAWCDILTLPFNVQGCRADGDSLAVWIGRTPQSPIEEATRLDFRFRLAERTAEHLRLRLSAADGPVGTRDYRIDFAAAPAGEGRTFVHLHYGYGHGMMSSLAMQAYLATSGADKVGFTEGRDGLVGGMRGVIERNTMRYFLAIEAWLDARSRPPGERLAARLERWFDATERYPRQLREMERAEYLAIKRAARRAAKGPG